MNNAQITVIGNTTADPELRFVGETPKVTFSLAVDRSWKDERSGEWQKETSYVTIVGWRDVADHVGRALGTGRGKGVRVMVSGRLAQRSWDDKETGEKRSVFEIVADEIAVSTRHIGADFQRELPSERGEGNGNGKPAAAAGQRRVTSSPRPAAQRPLPEDEAW